MNITQFLIVGCPTILRVPRAVCVAAYGYNRAYQELGLAAAVRHNQEASSYLSPAGILSANCLICVRKLPLSEFQKEKKISKNLATGLIFGACT